MLEEINKIIEKCNDDERLLKFVNDQLETFCDYTNEVVQMQYKMSIIAKTKNGSEYQEAVKELDKNRTIVHNTAIAACSGLNRLSEKFGLEPFYNGSIDNRHEVAEFIGEFVSELYSIGITGK